MSAKAVTESSQADHVEIISYYGIAQALDDGVIRDAHKLPDGAGAITGETWNEAPVYITSALYATMKQAVEAKGQYNDWRGVWWDVISMARILGAIRTACVEAEETGQGWGTFGVIITGTGQGSRPHRLKLSVNPDGLTFMLADED